MLNVTQKLTCLLVESIFLPQKSGWIQTPLKHPSVIARIWLNSKNAEHENKEKKTMMNLSVKLRSHRGYKAART